jgi:hypothetical protein
VGKRNLDNFGWITISRFKFDWHFIPEKNKRIVLKRTQESILYRIQREKLNELLSLEELILQKWLGI